MLVSTRPQARGSQVQLPAGGYPSNNGPSRSPKLKGIACVQTGAIAHLEGASADAPRPWGDPPSSLDGLLMENPQEKLG